ncbi:hypothetical protein [Allosphingosinicella sp.]|uniref:hypothetical protein n=1 Tax=Allosphingosinicella sp. TaxID=2823234 RepID=UPI0037848A64
MLRRIAALLVTLAGPAAAQAPAKPTVSENLVPPCDHLYLLNFAQGSSLLDERTAAITQIFAETHAHWGTRTRMIVRQADRAPARSRQVLAVRRAAAVRAVLARFGIPLERTEVQFEVTKEPLLSDTIVLLEIMSEADRERRAVPAGTVC